MARHYQHIHFVGIGGAGMSGIAELLLNLGYRVTGSDLAQSETTRRLESLGALVHQGHAAQQLRDADVLVYSSAVRPDNLEITAARERGIPIIPRAEMLAELMRMKYGIAVAGAHGKTTTTSMIATVLAKGGLDPTAVIGGKLDSLGGNAKLGQGEYLVAEADESDGTFLKLSPIITVVTNIDREHLDYYGDLEAIKDTFLEFINKIPFYGLAVICLDDPYIPSLLARVEKRLLSYGLSLQADLQARGIKHHEDTSEFQIFYHKRHLGTVKLPLPGTHNVLNALAAVAVGLELEVPFDSIRDALSDFSGAHRRFQVKAHIDDIMVVDDYAHHPSEIRTTLGAAKQGWGKRLLVVFQPHRFTRTYHLWEDFVTVFDDADTLIVMDIYPAGEDPIEGVDAQSLSKAIRRGGHKGTTHISDRHQVVERVMRDLLPGDMVLTLGAGDVWRVSEDIVDRLEKGDWPEHPEDK